MNPQNLQSSLETAGQLDPLVLDTAIQICVFTALRLVP
jgi:hypothetical protein